MTAEQLEELADGANPSFMGLDYEQAITSLTRRVIAAERVISAISLAEFDYDKWQEEDAEELDAALTAYREASK